MAELELKLLVAADDMAKARSILLAMAGRPPPSRTRQVSTCFDTSDRALRQRDLMLRVRKEGRTFFQTVTERTPAGDGEWEDRIRGGRPDFAAAQSGPHLPQSLGVD